MKSLALLVTLIVGICISTYNSIAQASPAQPSTPWITAISYEQTQSGNSAQMTIHIRVLQPNATGTLYPCAPGDTLTLDPLILNPADVTFSGGGAPRILDMDKSPHPEQEGTGFYYQLSVGDNLDLPSSWRSFIVAVQAHCSRAPSQAQQSPSILIRRVATNNPLTVNILEGEPQWNSTGNQDTLTFTVTSNWPIAIKSLYVIDRNGNKVAGDPSSPVLAPYVDQTDATRHKVILKVFEALQGNSTYSYLAEFTTEGNPIPLSSPLPQIHLGQANTNYTLLQAPSPANLVINNSTADFTFQATTNVPGSLSIVFDSIQINGSNTLPSSSSDGQIHTFRIPQRQIPDDNSYGFRFTGNQRSNTSALADSYPSQLVVAARNSVHGPIGLSLTSDKSSVVITYCVLRQTATVAQIQNSETKWSQTTGNSAGTVGGGGCEKTYFPYTASLSLSQFTPAPSAPSTATATSSHSGTSNRPSTGGSSSPSSLPTVPIQLSIQDISAAPRPLLELDLSAVLLAGQSSDTVIAAATTVANKKASPEDHQKATDTLLKAGISQDTITAIANLGSNGLKSEKFATVVGQIFGGLAKGAIQAYVGIPATK